MKREEVRMKGKERMEEIRMKRVERMEEVRMKKDKWQDVEIE